MKLKKEGQDTKDGPQKGCSRMKTTKKWVMTVCMSMILLTGVMGCTKTTQATQQTEEETGSQETPEETDSEADSQETPEETDSQEIPEEADSHTDTDDMDGRKEQNETDSDNETPDQSAPLKATFSEGTEFLGGTVQSVADDGMVFAQTTVKGEDESMVTLVDEKDAKKIPVKFTADTKVEHWIIQGGGAGIDMRDAALSDVKPGLGVELEGYYEGDNFVATRILIEEYK